MADRERRSRRRQRIGGAAPAVEELHIHLFEPLKALEQGAHINAGKPVRGLAGEGPADKCVRIAARLRSVFSAHGVFIVAGRGRFRLAVISEMIVLVLRFITLGRVMIVIMGVVIVGVFIFAIMMHGLMVIGGLVIGVGVRETVRDRLAGSAARLGVERHNSTVIEMRQSLRHRLPFGGIARRTLKPDQIVERAFQLRDQRAVRIERNGKFGKPVNMGSGLAVLLVLRESRGDSGTGQKQK